MALYGAINTRTTAPPAPQATVVHLFLIVLLNHAKPHQTLLMMGLTVTSTASMGETLVGLLAPAPVLPVSYTHLTLPTILLV